MTTEEEQAIKNLVAAGGSAEQEIAKIVTAVKAAKAGDKSQLFALLPEIVTEGKKDYAAFTAALPAIKSGYTTTEFWVCVVTAIATVVCNALGHPMPENVVIGLASLAGIYTFARTLVKKQAPAIITTVAAPVPAAVTP